MAQALLNNVSRCDDRHVWGRLPTQMSMHLLSFSPQLYGVRVAVKAQ
jgi:hypothetical protein